MKGTAIILCVTTLIPAKSLLDRYCQHLEKPYELILVDNGSTDGTLDFLYEVAQRPGPQRVVIIRNETDLGPEVARQQALEHGGSSSMRPGRDRVGQWVWVSLDPEERRWVIADERGFEIRRVEALEVSVGLCPSSVTRR